MSDKSTQAVRRLTLEPDEHMRWIYDYTRPDYNSDQARYLRERRAAALRNCPLWMLEDARANSNLRKRI